jgi:N-carbamoyl-L-amino-acid hydrolase
MMSSGVVCYDYLPPDFSKKFKKEDMLKSKSVLDKTTTFGEALDKSPYKGDEKNRLNPKDYAAMFELHIEQGPILEDAGNEIGVVTCVLGMFNYRIRFYGQSDHAGTTPMHKRKHALFASAQALCYLHEEIDKLGRPELVYTTGEILCHPNVHTVIPDLVDFSIDVRHEDPEVRAKVLEIVKSLEKKEWARCRCEVEMQWQRDTVYFDKELVGYVQESANELGYSNQTINSGAGHDAQFVSYMMPTTMIFVPSKDGHSHCEPEYTSPEQCTQVPASCSTRSLRRTRTSKISGTAAMQGRRNIYSGGLFCYNWQRSKMREKRNLLPQKVSDLLYRGRKDDHQCQQAHRHTVLLFRMVFEPAEGGLRAGPKPSKRQPAGQCRTVAGKC